MTTKYPVNNSFLVSFRNRITINIDIWHHLPVTSDESGDGDGTFYLQGGKLMPEDVLDECEEFSEKVIIKREFERTFLRIIKISASLAFK